MKALFKTTEKLTTKGRNTRKKGSFFGKKEWKSKTSNNLKTGNQDIDLNHRIWDII